MSGNTQIESCFRPLSQGWALMEPLLLSGYPLNLGGKQKADMNLWFIETTLKKGSICNSSGYVEILPWIKAQSVNLRINPKINGQPISCWLKLIWMQRNQLTFQVKKPAFSYYRQAVLKAQPFWLLSLTLAKHETSPQQPSAPHPMWQCDSI